MGIDINSAKFLLSARRRGGNFGDVLMIGRQDLNVYPAKMRQILTHAGLNGDLFAPGAPDTGFAEPLFKALGARNVHSLDASAFEGADFVRDLNCPVGEDLKQRFDLVFDGGTLEHVFNLPTALKNCMEMLRENGLFITHTCANNWCGHGFYQFSPELFYNVFSEENGFEVERLILHVVGPYCRWYEVANPKEIRSRVELFNAFPLQMLVLARRKSIKPIFQTTPQQSDYTPRWEKTPEDAARSFSPDRSKLADHFPALARLQNVLKSGWHLLHYQSLRNRRCFRPVPKD
jgi:SAM-dependent methyltransferase